MSSRPETAHVLEAGIGDGRGGASPAISNVPAMLVRRGRVVQHAAATTLFHQGFHVPEVFLIDWGIVKLTRITEDGREMIVGLRSRGSLLGAASVIVQRPHSTTAVTLTDCSLYCVDRDTFLDLVRTDSQFGWHLQETHSREVHDQALQLMGFRCLSARQRFELLMRQLTSIMDLDTRQSPLRVSLPLKHWEIAQLIGVTPEHFSRVLKQLKREGIMYRNNGTLIITDYQSLYSTIDT